MSATEFITYRDDLSGSISCGPLQEPRRVYVTWTSATAAPTGNQVVAIEFLPKER